MGNPSSRPQRRRRAVSSGPAGVEPESMAAMCPIHWSCDDESYYSTRGQCLAHCDGTCFYGPDCRGNCICE